MSDNRLDRGVGDTADFLTDLQLAQDRFEGLLVRPAARSLCIALDAELLTASLYNLERRRSYSSTRDSRALAECEGEYDVATAGCGSHSGSPSE
jgi:hypothetical protein